MKAQFMKSAGEILEKMKAGAASHWDAFLADVDDSAVERASRLLPYGFEVAPGIFTVHDTQSSSVTALGYVIEIAPMPAYIEKTADDLQGLLTMEMPDKTVLQVTLFATPEIRWATRAYRYCRTSPEVLTGKDKARAQTLAELARARASYLTRLTREAVHANDAYRVRHFRAWIAVTVPFSSMKGKSQAAQTKDIIQLRQKHWATLSNANLHPYVWKAHDLAQSLRELLNPQNAFAPFDETVAEALDAKLDERLPRAVNPLEAINKQIIERDTRIAIDEAAIEFSHAGLQAPKPISAIALSVSGYPDRYHLWQCLDWLGSSQASIPCPYLITTIIDTGEPEKTREHANLMGARAKQMAMSEMAHFLSYLQRRKDDYDIVEAEYARNGGLAHIAHQVVLFAPKEKATETEAAARSVFKAAKLYLSNDACMQWQGFLSSLPMTVTAAVADDIYAAQRATTQTLTTASQMIPVLAEYTGCGARDSEAAISPMLLLTGRHGQITPVDIFSSEASNYNAVIVGASGSGKSALTNDLITGNLATGGKCYVIDVGGSYKKLCHLLGGQWIEYVRDKPLVINPFEFVTNLTEDVELLIPILLEMVQPEGPTDDIKKMLMNHVTHLFHTREKGTVPSITTLVKSLKTGIANPTGEGEDALATLGPDQRAIDLANSLAPYAEGGIYAEYFNGPSTVNFAEDFIVLELEGLKTRKLLQNVILLCLIFMISRELSAGELTRHKMVVIDEAWDLLDHKHAADFINTGYRRARKQNASFITITQSFADYTKNQTAQAAFSNAHWQFALRQRADGLDEAKKITTFSDWEKKAINSLRMQKDEYAECLFRMGTDGAAILQIRFDDFSRLLYSTRADDVARINGLLAQGLSIDEAIHALVDPTAHAKETSS